MNNKLILWLLGVNWKTTLAGLSAIGVVIGKGIAAWASGDFVAVFSNAQELLLDISLVLIGLGLIKAKDQNVTGVGTQAKKVEGDGTVVNIEGQKIGKQSPMPAQTAL